VGEQYQKLSGGWLSGTKETGLRVLSLNALYLVLALVFLLLLPSSGLDTLPLRTERSDMPPTWFDDTDRESSGESGVTG
jgi:hypothetical protein